MNSTLKIVLFDRYPVFGSGIKSVLEKESEIHIQRVIHGNKDLFSCLKEGPPDLLIVDAVHYTDACIPLIRRIRFLYDGLKIFLIVTREAYLYIGELIHIGIDGMAFCDSEANEVIMAIRTVLSGKKHFPDEILKHKQLREYIQLWNINNQTKAGPRLTLRENEVLKRFAAGLTYKEIGNLLFISPRTVETHKNHIMAKLNLRTTADMIKFALLNRMI